MSLVRVGEFEDHATIHNTKRNVKHVLSDGHYEIRENSKIIIEFEHFQGKITQITTHRTSTHKRAKNYKLEDFLSDEIVERVQEYQEEHGYIDFQTTVHSMLNHMMERVGY